MTHHEELPIHPYSGLQAVGIVGGKPVFPIMGGSEDHEAGSDAGTEGNETGTPDAKTGTEDTGTETSEAKTGTGTDDQDPWADPDKAKAEIERLRKENASTRVNAKKQAAADAEQDIINRIGKTLGLIEDEDTKVDVDQLESKLHGSQIENAVYRAAASKQNLDVNALLDSRSFLASVKELDPTDKDFAGQVSAAIDQAVTDNPRLQSQPGAGKSGNEKPEGEGNKKPSSLGGFLSTHYSN